MKYRQLTLEELKPLEKDFLAFIIVNGYTGDDWDKLKTNSPEKADKILDLFSDMVFEKIMDDVKFLEFRSKNALHCFQCLAEKIVLVKMETQDVNADFSDNNYLANATQNPPKDLKVTTSEKEYTKERNLEIYDMTNNGCTIADGRLFKTLCLSL
ncbi:MAG: DUF6495 family protein [Chitinophagales bacterium]